MQKYIIPHDKAASALGVKPQTLIVYASNGVIDAVKIDGGWFYSEESIETYRKKHPYRTIFEIENAGERARRFDVKYGKDGYERLKQLAASGATLREISEEFGVSLSTARTWRRLIAVEVRGPTYDKQRVKKIVSNVARLFRDEIFRSFYETATSNFGEGSVGPIPLAERSFDFRTKSARLLERHEVLLMESRRVPNRNPRIKNYVHYIRGLRQRKNAFGFYLLKDIDGSTEGYLFMPSGLPHHIEFSASPRSKYFRYMNNFSALEERQR